jgi:hypothetical protein
MRGRESVLREILLGGIAAVAWLGFMHLYFHVVESMPGLPAALLDRDREEVEQNAALLESAGNFKAAAGLLLRALDRPHSPECVQRFAERAILDFSRASDAEAVDAKEKPLRKAIDVAIRFDVNDDLPKAKLERLLDRDALDGLKGQVGSAQARALKAEQEQRRLEAKQAAKEATADELKSQVGSLQTMLTRYMDGMIVHAAGFSGNVIDGDFRAAHRRLVQLLRETKRNDDAAKEALRNLESAIAAIQPANIPSGVTARIRRVDPNVMPTMLVVDFEVFDASGRPLKGLLSKDIAVIQGGRRLRTHAVPISRSESMDVSVLVDKSGSTQGAPNAATKNAVPDFIASLPGKSAIRISSFSDRSTLLADWTEDRRLAIAAVQGIRAGGGTSLYQSAFHEIQNLATRSRAKAQVIFTDGANSLPGPSPDDIVFAARSANVTVHFVALKGAGNSDTSVIERIARQTGGRTFLVQNTDQLTDSFRALANSLQVIGYRAALLDYDAKRPVQITIGGKGAVLLAVDAIEATQPLAQRQLQ